MIRIDGAMGEGGGQILRTSLSLSLVTGRPFTITRIRARRPKPGLRRQHLMAVESAARIGRATVTGNTPDSQTLTFIPREVVPGTYHFTMATAASCTLVLQTLLPPLLTAKAPSRLILEGGTHNPFAPPFDFMAQTFLPLIGRMGPSATPVLDRPGFYPAGGGRITVTVRPAPRLSPFSLLDRGPVRRVCVQAKIARLPRHIADRELKTVREHLGLEDLLLQVDPIQDARGPGNVVTVAVASDALTEVFTGFGRKGVPAERVAGEAADEAREYLEAGVPAGRHLADQLLLLLALAGGGRFRTLSPTRHTLTHMEVIPRFLDRSLDAAEVAPGVWEIAVR